MHNRLFQCPQWQPDFKKVWFASREDRAPHMEEWYIIGTLEDKRRKSTLQIPETLIEHVTARPKCDLRRP